MIHRLLCCVYCWCASGIDRHEFIFHCSVAPSPSVVALHFRSDVLHLCCHAPVLLVETFCVNMYCPPLLMLVIYVSNNGVYETLLFSS